MLRNVLINWLIFFKPDKFIQDDRLEEGVVFIPDTTVFVASSFKTMRVFVPSPELPRTDVTELEDQKFEKKYILTTMASSLRACFVNNLGAKQCPSCSNPRTITSQIANATTNWGHCVKYGTNGMGPRNRQEQNFFILRIRTCKKRQNNIQRTPY